MTTADLAPPTIVYVTSQSDAEAVANALVSSGSIAAAYHAGMGLAQRERVYSRFLSGSLRIVCATVAFGMGIDKADVRCVVHYHMPRSPEEYIQQCGRAGRDGLPAHCHALLDVSGADFRRLHSLVSAECLLRLQTRALMALLVAQLGRVVARAGVLGPGGEMLPLPALDVPPCDASLPLADVQRLSNLRPEVAETLLVFFEDAGLLRISTPRFSVVEVTVASGETPAKLAAVSLGFAAVVAVARTRKDERSRVVYRAATDDILAWVGREFVAAAGAVLAGVGGAGGRASSELAVRAAGLQRLLTSSGMIRELYTLQGAGRVLLGWSACGGGCRQQQQQPLQPQPCQRAWPWRRAPSQGCTPGVGWWGC